MKKSKLNITLLLLVFCFSLLTFSSFSQSVLEFTNDSYNFGNVNKYIPQPAIFEIKNTGTTPLILMPSAVPQNISVSTPQKFIQPNEKDTIYVSYQPKEVGTFKERIAINSNASEKPQFITITGFVESIIDCPNYSSGSATEGSICRIRVLDKLTQKPIAAAEIEIMFSKQNFSRNYTDREGLMIKKSKGGTCNLVVSKKGYITQEQKQFVLNSKETRVIELEKEIKNNIYKQPENQDLIRKNELEKERKKREKVIF